MLEYIFFDERPWRRFVEFLQAEQLQPMLSQGEEGWLVALPEDIDDALNDRIEACYEELLDYNETLVAEAEGASHVHTAGVSFTLGDGRRVQAVVDPQLMQRLLQGVTPQELGDFINAVVAAVERPDQRPLCQR